MARRLTEGYYPGSSLPHEPLLPPIPTWPDLTADQVHTRVAAMWDLTTGWPIPKFTQQCPACGSTDVGLKDFRFFEQRGATIPHRCDVTTKCTLCSLVLTYGLAVPADVFDQHQPGRRYPWRWVRDQIE